MTSLYINSIVKANELVRLLAFQSFQFLTLVKTTAFLHGNASSFVLENCVREHVHLHNKKLVQQSTVEFLSASATAYNAVVH